MKIVQPPHFATPKGYANGILAEGRILAVAGQIGWNSRGEFVAKDLVGQMAQALDNVLDVVKEAGGTAESIVSMTVFATDLDAYRTSRRALRDVWRARMGRHYPAMAVVGVAGLVEPEALVEIQALAILEGK